MIIWLIIMNSAFKIINLVFKIINLVLQIMNCVVKIIYGQQQSFSAENPSFWIRMSIIFRNPIIIRHKIHHNQAQNPSFRVWNHHALEDVELGLELLFELLRPIDKRLSPKTRRITRENKEKRAQKRLKNRFFNTKFTICNAKFILFY